MTSKRVLHVLDHLVPSSGVAQVVMTLIKGLSHIRQDIAVYGQVNEFLKEDINNTGGDVYKLPEVTQQFGYLYKKAFSQLLIRNKYTVIHGHVLNSAYLYLREAKNRGVPVRIAHVHNSKSSDDFLKRIRNNILQLGVPQWASIFVSCSLLAAHASFGKRKVHIIPNGIDTERFKYNELIRNEVRNELNLPDGVLCIGNVARLALQKNHSFMFRLLEHMPHAIGVFIGGGYLPKNLIIPPNAMILGERIDVHRFYQAFDVFILPSYYEGFPLSVIEAQCAGLHCFISDAITKEVGCDGNVTFLPINNSTLWKTMINNMVTTNRTAGVEAVQKSGFDLQTVIQKIDKLYS